MNLNIGLLIPRSTSYPLLSQHIVRAIKLAFALKNITPQFTIEDIGKGNVAEEVMSKANNLLLNDIDLCFAMVGDNSMVTMADIFSQSEVPLFLLDAGAKINYNEKYEPKPNTFIHNLALWQSVYALGQFCANSYANIVCTSSFFEAGYQFTYPFSKGYEDNGAKIGGFHSTQNFDDEDFSQKLANLIGEAKAQALLVLYNGNEADEFYSKCTVKGYDKGLPIVTTPLGLGSGNIELDNITVGATWFANLDNKENETFVNAYKAKHKKEPELFAALAYEAASVAANAVNDLEDWDADEFCNSIKGKTHHSVRGEFTYTNENENSHFPIVIKEPNANTTVINVEKEAKEIREWQKEQLSSGWFNPYPCS